MKLLFAWRSPNFLQKVFQTTWRKFIKLLGVCFPNFSEETFPSSSEASWKKPSKLLRWSFPSFLNKTSCKLFLDEVLQAFHCSWGMYHMISAGQIWIIVLSGSIYYFDKLQPTCALLYPISRTFSYSHKKLHVVLSWSLSYLIINQRKKKHVIVDHSLARACPFTESHPAHFTHSPFTPRNNYNQH